MRLPHLPQMTIRQRIIVSVVIQAIMICVIGLFVYFSFEDVLSKLRSIERIDDMNIALLEMRKAEKNYFLYNDVNALKESAKLGEEEYHNILSSKSLMGPILRGPGRKNYDRLLVILKEYRSLVNNLVDGKAAPRDFGEELRSRGQELTLVSEGLLKLERANVSRTINNNVIMLIAALGIIFIIQLILWQYFFKLIIEELKTMARMIKVVSEGRFQEVAVKTISPHNEIEIAIKAISDMAGQLAKREEEMLQAGKLASLGVMISGVAHELGNPLNNISLMAQTYLSIYDMLGDEEKKTYMGDIYNQTDRIHKIVEKLLDFSRQKKQELKEAHLKEIIHVSLLLVGNQLKLGGVREHVVLARGPAPRLRGRLPNRAGSGQSVYQRHSSHAQGWRPVHQRRLRRKTRDLILEVRDTGTGIPQEILPNIFDPFFSTKGTKGTGLGLSVSYGIIREHHGDIFVESEEGKGTRFIIKLPSLTGKGAKDGKKDSRGGR